LLYERLIKGSQKCSSEGLVEEVEMLLANGVPTPSETIRVARYQQALAPDPEKR